MDKPAEQNRPAYPGEADNIIAHDADWQYPAITEQHAYEMAKRLFPRVPNAIYIAFPWATLIDRLNTNAADKRVLLNNLRELPIPKAKGVRVITVCQHILLRKFEYLFAEAGITDVFWPHAVAEGTCGRAEPPFTLHPFPLYPVQFPKLDEENFDRERRYLYSFIGARANQWYIARTRDWIIDELASDREAVVVARDQWHYNKTVYDFQTHRKLDADPLAEARESANQFKAVLKDSLFALCPSGTGPNSIRLWESMAVGAIPVILADGLELPGPQALWEKSAVFCEETPEAVRELPRRLREIAADPALVASMRQGVRQLWRLYGTDNFISDIVTLAMQLSAAEAEEKVTAGASGSALKLAVSRVLTSPNVEVEDASFLLTRVNSVLCRSPRNLRSMQDEVPQLLKACERAKAAHSSLPAARRFDRLISGQGLAVSATSRPAVTAVKNERIKVCLFGRHSNRTPLYYQAYRPYFEPRVDWVDTPEQADVCLSGFEIDFKGAQSELREARRKNPRLQLAIVSEEPLWDTVWASDAHADRQTLTSDGGETLTWRVFNHQNSDIFDFSNLPYFLTTDDRFFARYAAAFARNATLTPDEILDLWTRARIRSAFYAEKREDPRYGFSRPEQDIYGLSVYRSDLASAARQGEIIRAGKGWQDGPVRQQIPDWHLDKIATLDQRCLIMSAVENTHQKTYLTEKLFDAYATLSVPLYYASPGHAVHRVLDEGSYLNLFGRSASEAAAMADAFVPDRAFAEAYQRAQQQLAGLFDEHTTLIEERKRVAARLMRALNEMAESPSFA